MPSFRALLVGCVFLFIQSSRILAQFYDPATEFHDPIQRLFVVEAARVLAWRSEARSNISEIKYELEIGADEKSTWRIRWVGPGATNLKSATVSYPRALLDEGPKFYRAVFKQLWIAGWEGFPHLDPKVANEKFWLGADRTGWSREESWTNLLQTLASGDRRLGGEKVAEVAGLLTHFSLPLMGDRLTLDSMVLARAGAWLMLTEQASAQELEALWPPLLFLAGREKVARIIWQKNYPSTLSSAPVAQAGWNLWLRKPTTREIYLFAANPTNLFMGWPMMAYDTRINSTIHLFADMLEPLLSKPADLQRLSNYAPLLASFSSVGGGHIFNGQWPVVQRLQWFEHLASYPATNESSGYTNLIHRTRSDLQKSNRDPLGGDPSLGALKPMLPLLKVAHQHGVGPLRPTGLVSFSDWLNYGWEMTGLQMGSRHAFVAYKWGLPAESEPIKKTVTENLEGLMPFFTSAQNSGTHNFVESLKRLQMVDGIYDRYGFNPNPFASPENTPAAANVFLRRYWVRPREFQWVARNLWDANQVNAISGWIQFLESEDNLFGIVAGTGYLGQLQEQYLKMVPDGAQLKTRLAGALPQENPLYLSIILKPKITNNTPFEWGQALETYYWKNPEVHLENDILWYYLFAGAYKSTKRFYLQCRFQLTDPVSFSHGLGQYLWSLGYLLNDPGLRKLAVEDSSSDSQPDMLLNILDAAERDDPPALKAQINDLIERYEGGSSAGLGGKLNGFLPLLPCLRDPKHPRRAEALSYFGRYEAWVILRWIWIQKFKLSKEEAITFLGGRENDLVRAALIRHLEKDQAGMLDLINKMNAAQNIHPDHRVFISILYNGLRDYKFDKAEPDLRPPGYAFIREEVMRKKLSLGRN